MLLCAGVWCCAVCGLIVSMQVLRQSGYCEKSYFKQFVLCSLVCLYHYFKPVCTLFFFSLSAVTLKKNRGSLSNTKVRKKGK